MPCRGSRFISRLGLMAVVAQQVEVAVVVAAALLERHVVVYLITPRQPDATATLALELLLDRDIPKLLTMRAAVRFLSMEPLLGPVDIFTPGALLGVDWVIVGGESGHGARPLHPDWARSLRDQCTAAGVPFLFKQHGEWLPTSSANYAITSTENRHGNAPGVAMLADGTICFRDLGPSKKLEPINLGPGYDKWSKTGEGGYQWLHCVGKKAAGRELDGRTHDDFPRRA